MVICGRRDKRERAAEEKRTKLKSPNFVISATRLSVRNIPFAMTEAQLRALAVRAVKSHASKEKPEVLQVRKGEPCVSAGLSCCKGGEVL